jgi:hypothetical protein
MDKVPRPKIVEFEAALQNFARDNCKADIDAINAKPELKAHESTLKKICEEFAKSGAF